jgi:hypothetical protein
MSEETRLKREIPLMRYQQAQGAPQKERPVLHHFSWFPVQAVPFLLGSPPVATVVAKSHYGSSIQPCRLREATPGFDLSRFRGDIHE